MQPVYLELGHKRVFACAIDWPGWCRSGKTEDLALEALAAGGARYARVAQAAGLRFGADGFTFEFEVVERVEGSASTDFGVPGEVLERDRQSLDARTAERLASLVAAAWQELDRAAAGSAAELRKGPRGGGRDRDKIVEHVLGAEAAYARKLGVRISQPAVGDTRAIAAAREAILGALGDTARACGPKDWPARYAARRIAWHALDHAWEIEDRQPPR
jgi:hypothetical protein